MSQKRNIFEEVGETSASTRAAPQGGMIDAKPRGARRSIRIWLFILFALVVAMIAVGGATRLTDSGLSITEWKPISGAIPPMNMMDWQAEFANYKQSPQFEYLNPNMTLSEFKGIFWWEWGHRQLGRTIGLVWFAGFVFFWLTKKIPPGWWGRLFSLGILGGLQGAIGWWMVASGLTGRMTSVASYRLATHLGLAFIILGLIAWFAFQLGRPQAQLLQARRLSEKRLTHLGTVMIGLVFVQILLGALTAGIDAGLAFPTWPSMNGQFLPSESFDFTPLWRNFFENPALVQFNHRMVAYLVFFIGLYSAWRARSSAHQSTRQAFAMMGAMIVVQLLLGITTALDLVHYWWLGSIHQLGAVVTWVLVIRARHMARFPMVRSIREGRA
ncbi:heme A synthase [Thioclava sp. BHET1]|nr:heme A synthase [Thioclava sp. BHET1]